MPEWIITEHGRLEWARAGILAAIADADAGDALRAHVRGDRTRKRAIERIRSEIDDTTSSGNDDYDDGYYDALDFALRALTEGGEGQ